jgi:uncharacterized protein YyaL (SSP411 family)
MQMNRKHVIPSMKRWLIGAGLVLVLCQNSRAIEWFTDSRVALEKAKNENKMVLLDFTGSDWCGWCMRLKSEVFDQPEFATFARSNLVMVEVDFPHHKALSQWQTAANNQLASDYHIEGFPSIIILNSSGAQIARSGYQPGGPRAFINDVMSQVRHANAVAAAKPALTAPEATAAAPAVPAMPAHYGELSLKGISGAKNHRLALINNQTLGEGESAKVKVHDAKVDITCKQIHDDSVTVVLDGHELELKLGEHL